MRRVLSIVLVLLMLAMPFSALIPVSAESEKLRVLYENDFNDPALASKQDEALAKALFGTGNYTYSTGGTLRIVDGALKITAGSSKCFEFLLARDEAISKGVVVEAEYVFHTGSETKGRFLMFTPKRGLGLGDSNMLLVAPYNDDKSRVAWRNESTKWQWLSYGPDEASSGTPGEKYKMRGTFSPEEGAILEVAKWDAATSAYGAYLTIGRFSETDLASFQTKLGSLPSMFSDLMLMRVQDKNIVTVDNVKVYTKTAVEFPTFVGSQTKGNADGETFELRLISAIDSLDYESVGYDIAMFYQENDQTYSTQKTVECQFAYESLTVQDGKDTVKKTAEELHKGASYLFALHIQNIPVDLDVSYEITPYLVDEEGEKIQGKKKTLRLKYSDWSNEIPFYDTADGITVDDGLFTQSTYRTRVTRTSRAEYDAYCTKLEKYGYVVYAENTMNNNHYATYTGERSALHVYYSDTKKEVRILRMEKKDFVEYPLTPVSDGTKVATPSVTLMSLDYTGAKQGANGAGFIFTMEDGSFVIIDGGWGYDTETFYAWLKANNKRADGKILIRAWMITHFHEDHYGNFEAFAKKYADEVTLEAFVVQLDNPEKPLAATDCNRINTAFEYFEGATYLIPQVGQEMYFGEAKFEFLHTQERLYPDYRMTDGNDYSLIAKVTFEDKTFLMTGDGYPQRNSTDLEASYGSYLKSDYVQAPHHGMGGTSNSFYDTVDADVVFVNTSAAALAERLASGNTGNYGALQYVIKTKKTQYYVADGGYQTIDLK